MSRAFLTGSTLALAAGALVPTSAMAQADLARQKNCLACHGIEKKVLGPAFKDVAARYVGQPEAAARLAAKVQRGGAGVWGPVPMPPNDQVSEADAKQLVAWIMGLK